MAPKENAPNATLEKVATPAVEPRYVSIKRFSKKFDTGRRKIYELIAHGDLVAVKLGSKTLLDYPHAQNFYANLPRAKIRPQRCKASK